MASADLARLLAGSFAPDSVTRRQAERGLDEMQALPNFGQLALVLAQDDAANKPIRQSAALIFKNWVKANWALVRALCLDILFECLTALACSNRRMKLHIPYLVRLELPLKIKSCRQC